MLSSGKDSLVKLWEMSTSRCLIAYTGAGTTGKQQHRTQAVFNHTEDYGKSHEPVGRGGLVVRVPDGRSSGPESWPISFTPHCLYLLEKTLIAGGPFYLVSMPGEVKYREKTAGDLNL